MAPWLFKYGFGILIFASGSASKSACPISFGTVGFW